MEVYNDINAYYPVDLDSSKVVFEDFKIIRLENVVNSMSNEDIERLKRPHRRSFFEFSIAQKESNCPYITIGVNKIKGVDNNLMFTSMGQAFSIDLDTSKVAQEDDGFVVAFKPSFMIKERGDFEIMNRFRFFNSYTFPHYVLNPVQLETIISLCHKIYSEYMKGEIYTREIIMGYLDVLLHSLNRILSLNPNTVALTAYDKIATRFEQKIFEDGIRISTIADYSSRLNISPNYLSESVKKATGKNAKQVLLSHKLIIGKSLLQEQKKNIAEISQEMGFSEPTNFTKFFKQMTGVTPNQFRNTNNQF